MKNKKALIFAGLILCFVMTFSLQSWASINKGVWYHQQPTSAADSEAFYGGSSAYEAFSGLAALEMGLQYFVPNIHRKMIDLYGAVDYHTKDHRGGLKSKDYYTYYPANTYTFQDFLSHKWLGRHLTASGCTYTELHTIITGVDTAVTDYTAETAWVPLAQVRDYLDNGWLIIMNTTQNGGQYVLVVGWDGSLSDPAQRFYYFWDPWKEPSGLSSYTYQSTLSGNSNNLGTAPRVNAYTINANQVNAIFGDQRGDGTVLAFRMTPASPPASATQVTAKGVWIWSSTAAGEGVTNVANMCKDHGITDIFLLVKGTSGGLTTNTLDLMIAAAHPLGIKVHAWVIVLNDDSAQGYNMVGTNWVDARDTNYRNYIVNSIIAPLVRDHDIDGIQLDCIRYPGNANQYSGSQAAITAYCSTVRSAMNVYKPSIPLSAAVMAEGSSTATYYGQNTANMSPYLAFIAPMTYTHNYEFKPSWVGTQIAYFVGQVSSNCKVWASIQASDDDGNYMNSLEMKQCVDYAKANGGTGVSFFRYPLRSWQWERVDTWSTP